MAVEGKATLVPPLTVQAPGTIIGTFLGAATVVAPPTIGAAGVEVVVVSGAAALVPGLGISAAAVDFPTHQKVRLNFELAPTRIQYER